MSEETPSIGELTGYISYDLSETYKELDIDVEALEALGEIEIVFQDGTKYRIQIDDVSD